MEHTPNLDSFVKTTANKSLSIRADSNGTIRGWMPVKGTDFLSCGKILQLYSPIPTTNNKSLPI